MKRFLALILCTVLTGSLFAGCADSKDKESSSTESKTESSTSTASKPDGPSWKQDTSPVELEWFVGYDWASNTFDPKNNTFDKYLHEETGVTINWSYGNLEKLNMLITTDSLPDIVTYNVVSSERLTMEDNGMLQPLDVLMEQYAPDLRVPQAMIDWYRNEKDNHWYAVASYFYDIDDTAARGGQIVTQNQNFARQDIMKKLNIKPEEMQTKDGFIAALKKVKEANIEYNGQVLIPYLADDIGALAEQFGIDLEDKNGNLLNKMRQPEYLEALLFFNRTYNEGLMTDEIFTMDNVLRKQTISSGGIFAGSVHNYLDGKDELFYSDNDALMISVGHIKGDGNKSPILTPSATGGWTGTMISKNCEHPDRAIRMFAFLTQEEIDLAWEYGGIDGYDIIDGEAIIKPDRFAEREESPQAFNAKYKSSAQDYFCDYVVIQKYKPYSQMNASQLMLEEAHKKYVEGNCYDDKIFTNVLPEGGSELAAISAQIDDYWMQQKPKIIMAETPEKAEEIYHESIQQMDTMGMQRLDDYKNERFQMNKKKMGVEFAWPRNK